MVAASPPGGGPFVPAGLPPGVAYAQLGAVESSSARLETRIKESMALASLMV